MRRRLRKLLSYYYQRTQFIIIMHTLVLFCHTHYQLLLEQYSIMHNIIHTTRVVQYVVCTQVCVCIFYSSSILINVLQLVQRVRCPDFSHIRYSCKFFYRINFSNEIGRIKVRSVSVLTFNLAVSSAINRLNPPTGEELEYYQWYAIKLTLSVLVPFFYDIFRIFCKKSTLLRLVVVVLQQ